ncbi:MAG TPA: NAD(P)-dependent oxidoreductase, partial [Rubrobacter sp.]|nr:NAD(P)-dependent oxidoreductase [Rubrobacter sp.]
MALYETNDAHADRRRRVLLTGATGYIAGQLLPAFRERYDLRLIDVREVDASGNTIEGVETFDLLSDEDSTLEPLFSDVDVVVHCGHLKPEGDDPEALYRGERRNVDMMQRVYRLALEHGVERVVAASTNQAAKWYENPFYAGLKDRVDPEDYPRPDSFYGWAKAAYEPLGFLYACGSLGRKLEIVQIRIVVPREIDASLFEHEPPARYVRELAGYISERDMQQLFCKSVETADIEDEYGVPFHIFYGVSDN